MKSVTIYSDGACQGNPGPGGCAAVLLYGENVAEISGAELATTNNRMEIQAAIEALKKLKEPCEVEFHTDSEYLKNGITKWIHAWKRKNWKRGLLPVKNADLWKALDEAASRHAVKWNWVRGHSGHPQNERCCVARIGLIDSGSGVNSLPHPAPRFQPAHDTTTTLGAGANQDQITFILHPREIDDALLQAFGR